tara:strand:+ start:78 stop:245 length:168 start_codon:yes stop_codon:yes gene_type:complete
MSTFMEFLNLPSQRVPDQLLQRSPNELPRRRNSNSELDGALEGRNYVISDRRELE